MMKIEKIAVGPMQANCYIVACPETNQALVLDPGDQPEKIKNRLSSLGLKLNFIVNTHGHIDHIAANVALKVPVYIHQLDAVFLKDAQLNLSAMFGQKLDQPAEVLTLQDGQKLKLGQLFLEVIHTPGHTPGGICLKANQALFTGDTLFAQSIGRCDFPYASEQTLLDSIRQKLLKFPDELVIYPGHGPSSTLGEERRSNPFLLL
ncbi:MBL fold metallo-hydrolase [Candidatus Omnitrophota bacterium]